MSTGERTGTDLVRAANSDRVTLAVWAATRLGLLVVAGIGGAALMSGTDTLDWYVSLWNRWETPYYESIAELGYAPEGEFIHNPAYFPGLALMIALGSTLGLSAALTGMVVSLIGSLAAVLALARLTALVGGRGIWGVVAWTTAPVAVFLVAPWAEAAFAGFAFWAWLMARRGAWIAAGLLAGGAALFRVNGVFLGLALVVMFLLARPRDWRRCWALAAPFLVTAAYFGYLWATTGDPQAWFTAQREGWDRAFSAPWTSLMTTIDLIRTFNDGVGAPHSRFVIEILAVVVLVAFGVILACKRWWAESVYVLITMGSLATSTYYYSVPRAAVVLIPVWMLVGLWMTNHRWFRWTYLIICIPALIIVTMRFAEGQWIS